MTYKGPAGVFRGFLFGLVPALALWALGYAAYRAIMG